LCKVIVYEENGVTVRIRMKKLGRKHRPFFRICAMEQRTPRDGRVLEELGTYDPMVPETDARARLDGERIKYWLGVGAQPSDRVKVLIKKYGSEGTHLDQQRLAIARLSESRRRKAPILPQGKGEQPDAEQPSAMETIETADNGDGGGDGGRDASAAETTP
jgi:small subunit ribosomal protein S16